MKVTSEFDLLTMTKRFANPFAPLHLNDTAADELERLARMFVQDHIGLYEQFLSEDNSRVDPQRWKLEVYFCKPCLDEALSSKAQAVARDEIITSDEVHEWSNTYGSSSGDEPVPLDDLNDH
ncbi:hypothetical protein KRP22_004802 [Phytophthora ramorum]|nr:hypothetical protein KRP22_10433 [Phytophthora ramorum]